MNAPTLPGLEPAKTPTHVAQVPYTGRSLCGIKDVLPIVAPQWVQAHVDGHGMAVCPDCDRVLIGRP